MGQVQRRSTQRCVFVEGFLDEFGVGDHHGVDTAEIKTVDGTVFFRERAESQVRELRVQPGQITDHR